MPPQPKKSEWIDVMVARVVLQDDTEQQSLHLRERGGRRGFSILIGTNEAAEIQRVLAEVELQRPLTHQLLFEVVKALDAKVAEVRVVGLRQSTYFARLLLTKDGGEEVEVDARPSDAIAVALRAGCPIRVAGAVMRDASTEDE
ncbi:MAG: bifunctional nuclease family protein [Planctomycetota bacterium]